MGRKNKTKLLKNVKIQKRNEEIAAQLKELTDQLLRICSSTVPAISKLWEEHKSISSIIEKIIKLEENIHLPVTKREETFLPFMQWIKANNVNVDAFSIEYFNEESWGLKAAFDIQEGQMWLAVPRSLMISSEDIKNSSLADILKKDPISKQIPQIALALFIIQERLDSQSKFQRYLDVLPASYDTVLYFSVAEFEELKGCCCLEEALKHYRHIVRQYAYYWQLFSNVEENSFTLRDHFTFNSYRWAVSTVMTRQNAIPDINGTASLTALVPLWDMCNHNQGKVSTDFSLEKNELQCYADRNFKIGEQIYICYGERPNSEFFVHNAFVCVNNPNDKLALKLGISKSDPLASQKNALLQRVGINQNEPFYIDNNSNPITERLLAFIHIFNTGEDELSNYINSSCCQESSELTQSFDLMQLKTPLSTSVQQRAWTFLKVRLELLLKSYKTNLEEDEELLRQKSELSSNRVALAVEMRVSEKRILNHALNYIASQSAKWE